MKNGIKTKKMRGGGAAKKSVLTRMRNGGDVSPRKKMAMGMMRGGVAKKMMRGGKVKK